MVIAAISNYDQVQNIYAYHNSHYNEMAAASVAPVQKTAGIIEISSQEDRTRLAVTYRSEERQMSKVEQNAVAKYTTDLKKVTENGQKLQYDLSNPYDLERRAVDHMLAAGMFLDVTA